MALKTISTFCVTLPSSVALWVALVMKASRISTWKNGSRPSLPVDLHIVRKTFSKAVPVQM